MPNCGMCMNEIPDDQDRYRTGAGDFVHKVCEDSLPRSCRHPNLTLVHPDGTEEDARDPYRLRYVVNISDGYYLSIFHFSASFNDRVLSTKSFFEAMGYVVNVTDLEA